MYPSRTRPLCQFFKQLPRASRARAVFVSDPGLITRDYGYWVENQLRERFELAGVPVSIDFVRRT
jgi:predicted GTPase